MPDTTPPQLLDLLTKAVAEAAALAELLELERTHLENRDAAGIEQTLVDKNARIASLEAIHSACENHSDYALLTEENAGVPLSKNANPPREPQRQALCERLNEFKEISIKCNSINELNGILISNYQKRNRASLDNLKGQARQERLYDAAGSTAKTMQRDSAPTFLSSHG